MPKNIDPNIKKIKLLRKLWRQKDTQITYGDCEIWDVFCAHNHEPFISVYELKGPDFCDRVLLPEIDWKKIKVLQPIKNPFI